ncbi:hypothetical protein VDGD_20173 [Verticillium dahliae]|nr:hypothetical protein VDGD_20173 [Verticillium dahliae]
MPFFLIFFTLSSETTQVQSVKIYFTPSAYCSHPSASHQPALTSKPKIRAYLDLLPDERHQVLPETPSTTAAYKDTSGTLSLGRHLGNVPLVKGINDSAGKLPGRDPLGKEHVELVVRPVPGLGQAEVTPDEDAKAGASPEEARVALEVPGLGVHEILLQDATNGAHDVGRVAGEADGLLTETGGADLGGERPAQLSGRELEDEGPEHGEAGLRHGDRFLRGPDVEDTDEEKHRAHASHAPDVNGAAAETGHQDEPVDQAADKGKTGAAERERVGGAGAETHL